jgi:predicted metal-dependent hydrolase
MDPHATGPCVIADEEYRRILREGLALFDAHKFFECHDKLEEAWKAVKQERKREPATDQRRDFTHGLILLSVAYHHWRNRNPIGTLRKYDEAMRLLAGYPARFEGVDLDALKKRAQREFEAFRKDPTTPWTAARVPKIPLAESGRRRGDRSG